MFDDLLETVGPWLVGISVILIVVFIGWCVVEAAKSEREWKQWATVHCKVIGHKDGYAVDTTGFSTSGNVVFGSSEVPSQTEYQCDDGMTYWKNF